jgi:hypothetical protein
MVNNADRAWQGSYFLTQNCDLCTIFEIVELCCYKVHIDYKQAYMRKRQVQKIYLILHIVPTYTAMLHLHWIS